MSAPEREWMLNGDGSEALTGLRHNYEAVLQQSARGSWRAEIYVPGLGGCAMRLPVLSQTFYGITPARAWAVAQIERFDGFEPTHGSGA